MNWRRVWNFTCTTITIWGGMLAIAAALAMLAISCVAPASRAALELGISTEQSVRAFYGSPKTSKAIRTDGTYELFLFLKPRPAAPRGALVVYEFDAGGILRGRGPTIIND